MPRSTSNSSKGRSSAPKKAGPKTTGEETDKDKQKETTTKAAASLDLSTINLQELAKLQQMLQEQQEKAAASAGTASKRDSGDLEEPVPPLDGTATETSKPAAVARRPPAKRQKKPGKYELCSDLIERATYLSKEILSRKYKLIRNEDMLDTACKEVWSMLPENLVDEEEFIYDYREVVYEAIKNSKSDAQSSAKKRAYGMSKLVFYVILLFHVTLTPFPCIVFVSM